MKNFNTYYLCIILLILFSIRAFADTVENQPGESNPLESLDREIQQLPSYQKPIHLEPGQKVKITNKTTIVRIKTTQSSHPISKTDKSIRPTWRCKNISDSAFLKMGTHTGTRASKSEWEKRAAKFITTYSGNCPNYEALEKELPPSINKKKYTQMLSTLFELNRITELKKLIKIARQDELEKHVIFFNNQPDEMKTDQKFLENFQIKHEELLRKASSAAILIQIKFPTDLKKRREASAIAHKFVRDYLKLNSNIKKVSMANLKNYIRNLKSSKKNAVREYLHDTISRTEYPKSNLLPSKEEKKELEGKSPRTLASLVKKESNHLSTIQLMLFEL